MASIEKLEGRLFSMARRLRRTVLAFTSYLLILWLVIYTGRPPSAKRVFVWTTVRYPSRPLDTNLASAEHAFCPGLATSTKPGLIVASTTSEDTSWTSALTEKFSVCIYVVNTGEPMDQMTSDLRQNIKHTVNYIALSANRAHESLPYLEFLIANYDHLPTAGMVFVHASRFAWHNDHRTWDNLALLQTLNISSALQPYGYHNMRCDWTTSMCMRRAKPQGSWLGKINAALEPHKARVKSDVALVGALQALFGDSADEAGLKAATLGRWDIVRSQCCAQFVVARENVWQHTREEYEGIRAWLLDGMDRGGATSESASRSSRVFKMLASDPDDRVAGRVISYIWAILFLPHSDQSSRLSLEQLNRQACPPAEECYCRLYGRCNLSGCEEGKCRGQYRIPKGYSLPKNWAQLHD